MQDINEIDNEAADNARYHTSVRGKHLISENS